MPSDPVYEPRIVQFRINARCRIEEKQRRRAKNRVARRYRRINRR